MLYQLPQSENKPVKLNILQHIFRFFNLDAQIRQSFPYYSILLILILVVIHFVSSIIYDFNFVTGTFPINGLHQLEALYYPNEVINQNEYWQYLTYGFLHRDLGHLMNNSITIFVVSSYLEIKYKWYRILSIYVLGVIVSSFSYITYIRLFNNHPFILIGASGGAFSLLGTVISEFYLNHERFTNKLLHIIISIGIIALHAREYINMNPGIATHGHLGGLIFGISPAILYIPNNRIDKYDSFLCAIALIINIIMLIGFPIIIYCY
jgi:membrane associated rhomboid family serine protease